jgi:hypothetical protein
MNIALADKNVVLKDSVQYNGDTAASKNTENGALRAEKWYQAEISFVGDGHAALTVRSLDGRNWQLLPLCRILAPESPRRVSGPE